MVDLTSYGLTGLQILKQSVLDSEGDTRYASMTMETAKVYLVWMAPVI